MAGILITAGQHIRDAHDRTLSFFTGEKQLSIASRQDFPCLSIVKLARRRPSLDPDISPDDADIIVTGTLIYRGILGNAAVKRFRQDLRESPVEALMEHCDGPFCIVLWEEGGKRLTVVTDHAGICNLYRYRTEEALAISSSSMALSRNYPVTPNPDGIAQFLRTASVYGSETIYQEITVLEPATMYSYEIGQGRVKETRKRYWQPPREILKGISFPEARDLLAGRLLKSFEAMPRKGLICDFTAGFDSRLIISVMSGFMSFGDMSTFVFGPEGSKEVRLVGEYCRCLGLGYNHLALPKDWGAILHYYVRKSLHLTDGEENVFTYAPILWAQEYKSQSHDFSVNGLGGEIYRDFWWIQEITASRRPANLERLISMRVLQYEYDHTIFSQKWSRRMSRLPAMLKQQFQSCISDLDIGDAYNTLQIDSLYFREKIRRWAGRTISSSGQVISSLTPLTMKGCVEAALSIPPGYKRNARLVKGIVEKLSRPLSELRMLSGAPCQNITMKNAHKFAPLVVDYGKRGTRKIVQKALNRTVLLDRSVSYQPSQSFASLFSLDSFDKDFSYGSLATGSLYDPDAYAGFYRAAHESGFPYYTQLGNLMTLELRMRNDNIRGELA